MPENSRSSELYDKAATLMPGGVSSPVRAFRAVGGKPVFFKSGAGAKVTDADGNELTDFCMSWGPLILGHAHPAVMEAVLEAAKEGLSFGACSEREVKLAQAVTDALPGCDKVRFVSSGTEAVMTAIRLARGATDRPYILKFDGCYHGHSDGLLVKGGSGLMTFGIASSAGIPEPMAEQTLVAPLDDEAALEEIFEKHGDQLACAVMEVLPANSGLLPQRPEFLRAVREACRKAGALFIADEVITGFRLGYGAMSVADGLEPDLVTLGKVIGGGMPVGAVAGPDRVMDKLAPVGPVYQAGTLSGNPVAMAAGLATLTELAKPGFYDRLEELGKTVDAELAAAAGKHPVVKWVRRGSLFWLYMAESDPPRRADAIASEAVDRFNGLYWEMIRKGFYLPPSGYEVCFVSAAHTDDDIKGLAAALGEAL
jgi:glutamate-1-semialdehyde 2,1-aminomutase